MQSNPLKHPFVIEDTKNPLAYNSLILGLLKKNPKMVEIALRAGAKVDKVKVSKDLSHSGKWSRPKHNEQEFISLEKFALLNCSTEIYSLIFNKLPQKDKTSFIVKYLLDSSISIKRQKKNPIPQKEISQIIRRYVSKETINTPIEIYDLSSPYDQRWNDRKTFKISLLSYACFCGNVDAVKTLMTMGSKVNIPEEKLDPIFSLFEGKQSGYAKGDSFLEILNLLVKSNVNLEKKNKDEKRTGLDLILDLDSSDLKMVVTEILKTKKRG